MFSLGYRTLHVTQYFSIHPLEIVLWLLFIGLIFKSLAERHQFLLGLPPLGWMFVVFWPIGIVRAFQTGVPGDLIIAELILFVHILPVFGIVRQIVTSQKQYNIVMGLLCGITFYISALGIVEYFFPALIGPFKSFFAEQMTRKTADGFDRASFSFWGSPVVTHLLVLFLPFILAQWPRWERIIPRAFLILTIVFSIVAMFIGGYRTIWLIMVVEVGLFFVLRRRITRLGFIAIFLWIGFSALPLAALDRVNNFMSFGFDSDSSARERELRIEQAWNSFLDDPWLGRGWGSAGWVHSDVLQIATNLGSIAASCFVLWYATTLFKAFQFSQKARGLWQREHSVASVTFLIGLLVILFTQAVIVLAQLIIPIWFLFALVHVLPSIREEIPT